jgi:hypothetical protein
MEVAAYKNVDMERAKNDLEEHQLVCPPRAAPVRHPKLPTKNCGTAGLTGQLGSVYD